MTPAQKKEAAFQRVASASDRAVREALFDAMRRARRPGETLMIEAGVCGGLTALWTLTSSAVQDPTPERVAEYLSAALADMAKAARSAR